MLEAAAEIREGSSAATREIRVTMRIEPTRCEIV